MQISLNNIVTTKAQINHSAKKRDEKNIKMRKIPCQKNILEIQNTDGKEGHWGN